jgi:hypothetical protein
VHLASSRSRVGGGKRCREPLAEWDWLCACRVSIGLFFLDLFLAAAKNEKIKQGVADQKEATLENIDYGHGVGVNSPPKKKAKTGDCVDGAFLDWD